MTRLVTATLLSSVLLFAGGAYADDASASCSATATECARQIRAMMEGKAFLGVKLQESRWGVEVKSVVHGSPAAAAGLRDGDRIYAINGKEISASDLPEVKKMISNVGPNGRIYLTVVRYGTVLTLQPRLRRMSDAQITKVVASHLRMAHQATQRPSRAEVQARADH